MAALGQTIAVFDKSGKAVSTSKQLINVFKEAKLAYRERKAEIVAGRQAEKEEKRSRRPPTLRNIEEACSETSSRRGSQSSRASHHTHKTGSSRPSRTMQRSETSPVIGSPRSPIHSPRSPRHFDDFPPQPISPHALGLPRRHSTDLAFPATLPPRPNSTDDIDMDLAYGDLPPDLLPNGPSPSQNLQITPYADDEEVRSLITKVKTLLEEADCLQASATAMITSLQKNPDAMAAVALTLAEISNIAKRLAPGALMAMKGSAPAVFALLASPQFLIAAGVGVGLTVVCLGGYKIVKKIKMKNAGLEASSPEADEETGMDEMLEIGGQVSTIESWRQGIAVAEGEEPGSTVEGEFITPKAAAISRLNLHETGSKDGRRRRKKKSKDEKSSKGSEGGSEKGDKEKKKEKEEKKGKEEKKVKKGSQLRLMFK